MELQAQRCASRLMSGAWIHDGVTPRHLDSGWWWKPLHDVSEDSQGCPMLSTLHARHELRNRWLVVIGDSVGRFIYSALLALVNATEPELGWPTHTVRSGSCMAHVVAANASVLAYGYYHPACQLRWKGTCNDDGRGRSLAKHTCTGDVVSGS